MNRLNISKPKLNLIIDVVMLLLLAAIAGIGFLIKYVLVPGYKRNTLYGSDVELYFMDLTRHDWGRIHLWLSFGLLALIVLHIILHWKMIVCIFRNMVSGKPACFAVTLAIALLTVIFILGPLLMKPVIEPLPGKQLHQHGKSHSPDPSDRSPADMSAHSMVREHREAHQHEHRSPEIYGYMSLNEVAGQYSIPVAELADFLQIPVEACSEKIGRLKRTYGFGMQELKNYIQSRQNE